MQLIKHRTTCIPYVHIQQFSIQSTAAANDQDVDLEMDLFPDSDSDTVVVLTLISRSRQQPMLATPTVNKAQLKPPFKASLQIKRNDKDR